ncbi:MAG: rod shape-determining protein MreC [Gammaproteobacteria bacterium 39-13]|nr:rod shape-determining protein MreC [Gammaproteobacteria bacterium]OJV89827.1 MAG: rod shape-determining protein MreC [Gammaproteobacteria bacterium 39-13]
MLASFILIFAGERWPGISTVQHFLARAVSPIQSTVDMPISLIEQTEIFFKERVSLLTENASLRQQHIYLQAQVQKLRALEAENHELRELLQSVGQEKESFSEARMIHADIDPFRQQILLNKGKDQGVEVGQPVIDAHGLVGVVLDRNKETSRVLLLTDTGFAVPVQSVRSGERAIATGGGTGGELRLNYVPRTSDFMEGDQLVTSGLGGRFPAGYPVGVITSIQHDPSTRFTLIGVSPSAKLGQLRHILLVKQHDNALKQEITTAAAGSTVATDPKFNQKVEEAPSTPPANEE